MDLNENSINIWHPLDIFDTHFEKTKHITALVVLNQPITKENESKLMQLWANSTVKFCVDGGTNRLYDWCQDKGLNYVPDYICGDLDSINDSILNNYLSKGAKCVRLSNQDLNDFTKTLRFAINFIKYGLVNEEEADSWYSSLKQNDYEHVQIEQIYCFCDFTGRLDHALANLSTLYDECLKRVNTYLISSESVTFLLRKGENIIYINDDEKVLGKYCGFFPLAKSALVTTRGLKWNLNKQTLKFGSFVSSSNEFDFSDGESLLTKENISNEIVFKKSKHKKLFIETDEELLWTMSIN